MTKRMVMDATHPEEVRVAIVQDNRLLDLDIETATKEQIKGNIYLGRVTRVEPSLQAAFVDFNGGRQGFLSVSDLHPKLYPVDEKKGRDTPPPPPEPLAAEEPTPWDEVEADEDEEEEDENNEPGNENKEEETKEKPTPSKTPRPPKSQHRRRRLPIQKILSANQTLLVQVVKEARGGKGASLTTNISLAGRYTVLLPENHGGGGISRKIQDPQERKELKKVVSSMEVPPEVSLIIRTAGLGHTKRDISRDMKYLLRLWRMIQEKSAKINAPALIHEEGDLIIRTIRDLYSSDMTEILIEGKEGYRRGKDFMRLLMPRYVKVVQQYKDPLPLFSRFQVENQIELMHERNIQLRSGGYLVIDITEALVTIDINSGRATREKDVETTAFKTNLQAVDEIARQLRLRDLGGLVVIDFIDMEEKKHNLEVEKRLKEAFKQDRAKIQLGRISQFGLFELSRQRLKPTFSETNRQECPRCQGLGTIRSVDSSAIHIFRLIEEEAGSGKQGQIYFRTPQDVANFLLNRKRNQLVQLEETFKVEIIIQGDANLETPLFKRDRPKGDATNGSGDQKSNKDRKGNKDNRGEKANKDNRGEKANKDNRGEKGSKGNKGNKGEKGNKSNRKENPAPQQPDAPEENKEGTSAEQEEKSGRKRRRRRRRKKSSGESKDGGQNSQSQSDQANQQPNQESPSSEPNAPEANQPPAHPGSGPQPVTPLGDPSPPPLPVSKDSEQADGKSDSAAPPAANNEAAAPPPSPAKTTGVPGLYVLNTPDKPVADAPPSAPPDDEAASPDAPPSAPPDDEAASTEAEDTEAKPRTASRSRRRRRRKPARERTEAEATDSSQPSSSENSEQTSGDSSNKEPPQEASPEQTPQEAPPEQTPQVADKTTAPQEAPREQTPQEAAKEQAPQVAPREQAPEEATQTLEQAPQVAAKEQAPSGKPSPAIEIDDDPPPF
ncbi:MAG: Rne/Rng family ribonuclease [Magnetococcales bacterium]|nr:Rne/Rng family ribonuclease [Magnetococcales bacterium]